MSQYGGKGKDGKHGGWWPGAHWHGKGGKDYKGHWWLEDQWNRGKGGKDYKDRWWPEDHLHGGKAWLHWKGGKEGKNGKGGKHGKGGNGWSGIANDLSAFTAGGLIAEGSLGWGVSGACFRGTYQTERGRNSVAIKPANNWVETVILARIFESDPPPCGVVPVLHVQHATPSGNVNVTALASHGTLGCLLEKSKGLNAALFLAVIASISDGLASLHSKNIIHCDLKPDNVVLHVTETGEICLWLIDFGDARLLDEPSSWYSQGWGAPEVQCQPDNLSGQYSSRTDSWCLAQCAAWLWAGGRSGLRNPAWMYDDMPLHQELQKCLTWDAAARPEATELADAARAALRARDTDAESELKKFLPQILTV